MNNELPIGFISVEEAIKLIESDSRTNARVDAQFLLDNLPYLRVDGNYTIKKLKHVKGKIEEDGEDTVHIFSEYQRAMLEHCIVEHWKQATGRDIDPEQIGIRKLTTAVDDEKNPQGRIANNTESDIKLGDALNSGSVKTIGG